MSWVQKLDEVAWEIEQEKNPNRKRRKKGTMPTKFHFENLYVPEMKKYVGAYLGWRYSGYPAPRLIGKDGSLGTPFDLELKFPGSLRTLLHPGWVMLCGPMSIESCRFLLHALEPQLAKALEERFHTEAPDVASRKRSTGMLMFMQQIFYTTCYVDWLKKIGSFEAFIGALGLSIEYFFHESRGNVPDTVFQFDPKEWVFCNSLEASNLSFLIQRIDDLNHAYLDKATQKNYSFLGLFLRPHVKSKLDEAQREKVETIFDNALFR